MASILKFLLSQIVGKIYWFSICLLFIAGIVSIGDARFYLNSQRIDVRVLKVESTCTLTLRDRPPGGRARSIVSDPMDCDRARAIEAANPDLDYSLGNFRTRTLLSFREPDGTLRQEWSKHRFRVDGRRAESGDTVTAAIDPRDRSDIRRSFDLTDYGLHGTMFAGAVLGFAVAGPLKRFSRGQPLRPVTKNSGSGSRDPEPERGIGSADSTPSATSQREGTVVRTQDRMSAGRGFVEEGVVTRRR